MPPAAAGGSGTPSVETPSSAERADTPLARRALHLDVAERLRGQIFERRLEPGNWIDEQRLAVEYGISRTPLREALKVLAAEGLVTTKVRRGAYVTETSADDVRQVYHLLGVLESDAAASVPEHATAGATRRTRSAARPARTPDLAARSLLRHHERIHMALMRVAGNRWAEQMVVDLRKVMKLNRHHSLFRQGRIAESPVEHRALMDALAARDGAAAARLMRAHFDNGLVAAVAA